jgi:hypothetical protein
MKLVLSVMQLLAYVSDRIFLECYPKGMPYGALWLGTARSVSNTIFFLAVMKRFPLL